MTDHQRFGTWLLKAREARGLTLSDVAAQTKVASFTLGLLEQGRLAELPADVFVRGFVRAYARVVGLPERDALAQYDRITRAATDPLQDLQARAAVNDDAGRGGVGMALFVIILLLIAALTLSLLLRPPPDVGEGLSLLRDGAARARVTAPRA